MAEDVRNPLGFRAGGDEKLVFQDRTLVDDKTIIYITLVDEKTAYNPTLVDDKTVIQL